MGASVHGLASRLRAATSRGSFWKRSRKSGPYGGDDEQRALGVFQRAREQAIEAEALVRFGEGEQLLELIDGERKGGVVLLPT